jgi:hypothetical protein
MNLQGGVDALRAKTMRRGNYAQIPRDVFTCYSNMR